MLPALQAQGMHVRAASRRIRTWPERVEGCVTNLENPATLHEACQEISTIVHLSLMSENHAKANPHEALRINAGGTLSWLEAARASGVRRFVQLSTYKVYGNSPEGIVTEHTPTAPRSHYALTHQIAEEYVRWLYPNAVILRLSNAFGAPTNETVECWEIIVNQFCRQAVESGIIKIRSSGRAWRSFLPLDDVSKALVKAVCDLTPGTYNLGSPTPMKIVDMANRVAAISRTTLGINPGVETGSDPAKETVAALDFRTEKLASAGFTPSASIDDEIARILQIAQRMFGAQRR